MRIYGLTGKTGAGKSTVAKRLEKEGVFVVDGDVLARKIMENGSSVLKKLVDEFGKEIMTVDGALNRKKLAAIVFDDEKKLKRLNEITHNEIDLIFEKMLEKAEKDGFKFAVFDAAALLESPSKKRCNAIIVVNAEKEVRLGRILLRDSLDRESAEKRINAQKDDEYYLSQADFVFENNESKQFEEEFERLMKTMFSV